MARLRAGLRGRALLVRSNRALRGEVLAIFEQTFAVTRLLEAMGLVDRRGRGDALAAGPGARAARRARPLPRARGEPRPQLFRVFLGRGLAVGAAGLGLGASGAARSRWCWSSR